MADGPTDAITLTQPWAILSVAPVVDLHMQRMVGQAHRPPALYSMRAGQPPKIHETRQYRLGNPLPRRMAIHAGQGAAGLRWTICQPRQLFTEQGRDVHASTFVEPYRTALEAVGYSFLDPWQMHYEEMRRLLHPTLKTLPLGRIVGVVTIANVIRTDSKMWAHAMDYALGNWESGRHAWTMLEPACLSQSIVARGYQSIWKLTAEQLAELCAQGVR
jgi:hypothetical protein